MNPGDRMRRVHQIPGKMPKDMSCSVIPGAQAYAGAGEGGTDAHIGQAMTRCGEPASPGGRQQSCSFEHHFQDGAHQPELLASTHSSGLLIMDIRS